MKQIREFMDQTEALIAKEYLEVNGVHAELHGGKDYSTHIVGGTQGRYFLGVEEDLYFKADNLLKQSDLKIPQQIEHPTLLPEVSLKKAVMFAIIAVVFLPIIGNWISIRETINYAKVERESKKKWLWIFLISWLQVPGVFIAWTLIHMLFLSFVPVLEIAP